MATRQKRNKKVIGETLSELDANAGHLSQTSRETDVPVSTILWWRDHYASDPLVERYRKLKNEELADRFRVVSFKAIERLSAEIDDVPVQNLCTIAAIGADKQLLLTGQPTSIVSNLTAKLQKDFPDVPEEELREYASELLQ